MKSPKILILYHTNQGRNDGPPLYWWDTMKNQMGLDVTHLAPEGDISRFGGFDYTFWVDYGEDGLPVDHTWKIPKNCGKTIYVCSDAHIDNGYRYEKAKEFDYVFFNQKRFTEEYKPKKGQKVFFLPHAGSPTAYPKFDIVKKYDVGFIGHIQDIKNYNGFTRTDFLDRMFREFPNFYFGTRNPVKPEANMFEDASKHFGESRIALNISIKDDLNMRLFEILASGSFQLTNYLPTLADIGLVDGEHIVTYKTLEEAVEKAKYYLEHEEEREKIAQAGYEWFSKQGTYQHRVEAVLKAVGYPSL